MARKNFILQGDSGMSEQVLKVLESMKDKDLAELIRMYLEDPSFLKLHVIFLKMGINFDSEKVNVIITSTHEYEDRGILFQQIGAIIVDGLMYVLRLVYNPNFNEARIELKQEDYIVLQYYAMGDHHEN